jgi:hypothetical protein
MLPDYFQCSACREKFTYTFRDAYYYVGVAPIGRSVDSRSLLPIPARPAWCKDCDGLCIAEDIAPLRAIEAAYGAARRGRKVEYPVETCFTNDPLEAAAAVAPYVHWRMGRRHAARALCCGGTRFQFMDVAQPLLKHAECEFGFVEPVTYIGSYIPRLLGVDEPANLRLYNTEGELIGRLTFCRGPDRTWDVEQGSNQPTVED